MIDTLYIANFIEKELNKNSLGEEFRIFADEGDLIKYTKQKALDCGIVEVTSNSIVPIRAINFQTINTQITIIADLSKTGFAGEGENNRPQSQTLIAIKECINEMITRLNGQTLPLDRLGKTYTTTINFGLPTVGTKTKVGHIYDALPIYFSVGFVFFENGISSNDINIEINGENIYFTRAVVSRVKTADQSTQAVGKKSKTLALVGGKSLDITLPVLDTSLSKVIMEDVLDDTKINRAVNVKISTPLADETFIGILGNTSLSMDIGATAGYNISLVQGFENALVYDDNWKVTTETQETVTKNLTNKGTIYWGDGTVDNCDKAGTKTHTYADGKDKHIVRVFGGV